jgi:hypothetical protein
VVSACLAAIVVGIGVAGGGVLGAWQGLSENATNMVTAAAAASAVPVTSVHCSGLTPACPTTCTDAQGTVTISWTAVRGSTGITVQRATTPAGAYSTIATLAGSAITYTDSTAAYNTQYYYEVYSGTLTWMPGADVDMALALPPTGGTDDTVGTGGTNFSSTNLAAMSAAGGTTHTTTTGWGSATTTVLDGQQVNGLSCASATKCWAATQSGAIWATVDGGYTWTQQMAPSNHPLSGVDFISASDGWAVGVLGNNETVFVTTDGGATWTEQFKHPQGILKTVDFVNADDGWLVGQGGSSGRPPMRVWIGLCRRRARAALFSGSRACRPAPAGRWAPTGPSSPPPMVASPGWPRPRGPARISTRWTSSTPAMAGQWATTV